MHMVTALLYFVVVIHWLIFPYPSGLLHWHCGNLTIAPVPAKKPWWIWINTSCEFIINDCITTTKQNTTKPCAYFLGYTVTYSNMLKWCSLHYLPRQCSVVFVPQLFPFWMTCRFSSRWSNNSETKSLPPSCLYISELSMFYMISIAHVW